MNTDLYRVCCRFADGGVMTPPYNQRALFGVDNDGIRVCQA